jgi:hypothetical protein
MSVTSAMVMQMSVNFILFPVMDSAGDKLTIVCAVRSGKNFKVTWLVLVASAQVS